jgi:hypothetical protein
MTLATVCTSCFTSNEISGAAATLTFRYQSGIVLIAT